MRRDAGQPKVNSMAARAGTDSNAARPEGRHLQGRHQLRDRREAQRVVAGEGESVKGGGGRDLSSWMEGKRTQRNDFKDQKYLTDLQDARDEFARREGARTAGRGGGSRALLTLAEMLGTPSEAREGKQVTNPWSRPQEVSLGGGCILLSEVPL